MPIFPRFATVSVPRTQRSSKVRLQSRDIRIGLRGPREFLLWMGIGKAVALGERGEDRVLVGDEGAAMMAAGLVR
ncbi:hypothetical protein ABIA43_003473 [Bradyrhizobium sp. USDA 328]